MTEKVLRSLARSIGTALRKRGHRVPRSIMLHALASSIGKTDWRVLTASKKQATRNTATPNMRGALMPCVAMLQECLNYADNDTADTIDSMLVSAQQALEESVDSEPPNEQLIEAAQLVLDRWGIWRKPFATESSCHGCEEPFGSRADRARPLGGR